MYPITAFSFPSMKIYRHRNTECNNRVNIEQLPMGVMVLQLDQWK